MVKPKTLPSEVSGLLMPFIAKEFKAWAHYRALSNYAKGVGFKLAAAYFQKESDDELTHAKRIEDFLVDWNVMVTLPTTVSPQSKFKNLVEGIEMSYQLEYELYEEYEKVSAKILDIGDLCVFDFLQFFRNKQTQSVAEYSDMLNTLEGVEPNKMNLLLLEETLFGE